MKITGAETISPGVTKGSRKTDSAFLEIIPKRLNLFDELIVYRFVTTCQYYIAPDHCFVQQTPNFRCSHCGELKSISHEKGFEVKCRNPRCSYECWEHAAYRESEVTTHFISGLPTETTVLKGCFKLRKDAGPDEHAAAKATFTKYLRRKSSKLETKIHLRAVRHETNPLNAHWDYTIYCQDLSERQLTEIIRHGGRLANFTHVSVKPIRGQSDRACWFRYMHKTTKLPRGGGKYKYLPAYGGERIIWSTQGFFQGRTVAGIWKEICAERFAPNTQNKQSDPPRPPAPDPDPYQAEVDKLEKYLPQILPQREEEAAPATLLAWLLGSWAGLVEHVLEGIPTAKRLPGGKYWVLRANIDPRSWVERMFPGLERPWHADFPEIWFDDDKIDHICKPAPMIRPYSA